MRSVGNSAVQVCIENILATFKSEVPYARNMGINHATLDLPADEVEQQLIEDAELAIDEYEPRVDVDNIEMDVYNENGTFKYKVDVSSSNIENTEEVEE